MFGCRKIYGNLLLLSVMLLSLGASVRPRMAVLCAGENSWQSPMRAIEFQWDNRSGAIVYRSSGVIAAPGNEFDWILPETFSELIFFSVSAAKNIASEQKKTAFDCRLPISRAPPAEKTAV